MASLHVFVVLLGLVVLCHSECTVKGLRLRHRPPFFPKGCSFAGKKYSFGDQWDHDCKSCICLPLGSVCCDMFPSAHSLPPICRLEVDKKTCAVKLVLKSDKTKPCPIQHIVK
ncbi:uncharacterized protein LOC117811980 [Notolabrus celidotus]|uniref:uncharacterized protein LOC117811980 n=1 Tax=Notolabrus celidotus TaxID=1203425 RepID=UPI0014906737|nr:uncharacterized protein LOC117811980 [Notolabrus celidotus]